VGVKQPKGRRVSSERAKKRRTRGVVKSTLVVVAVAGGLLAVGFLDRDTGVGHWLDLRRDAAAAKARIGEVEARIAGRESEARALAHDPVAIEAAIREDLGLARPGEWVVRERGASTLRNP
jgi:cell division protein FtsB